MLFLLSPTCREAEEGEQGNDKYFKSYSVHFKGVRIHYCCKIIKYVESCK